MKKSKILIYILLISFCVSGLYIIQSLVMPKYMSGIVEGSLIEAYYDEEKNHDVIFIGDCEVYETFSPVTLWEEYGISSFIRGSAQQLIWQSYYLLEETLKYEKPEVVVFNVLSMKYNEPQREAYNRMTLDGMKMSMTKLKAINSSMMEDENLIDYLFPLLRYHSRWSELTSEDVEYMFEKEDLFHNGYYMRADVKPVTTIPTGRRLPDYQFEDNAYEYLDKMVELCKENDIELVLMKAPTIYPYWYDEWEIQMEEYALENDLVYINYLELLDEVGIDFDEDTYDSGLHMNLYGAEKISLYFGEFLKTNYELVDHREDAVYNEIWADKINQYYDMEASQLADIEAYGKVLTYSNEVINESEEEIQ